MTYIVVVRKDGEEAHLACDSLEEAKSVRQSFINYGKCEDVYIIKGEAE